jgi:CheY-like chemotaxis protein
VTGRGPILVVEDDADIREIVEEALADEGYEVMGAADGLDALERLRAATVLPRLILLDLMMPRMNGLELREALLKIEAWSSIPVVIVSADANAQEKSEAMRVAGLLQKPVKLRDLVAMVERTLPAAP